ncbi:type IV pilus assembly protein PilP [Geothermobacter ehrlichii]|uniref:Type IV pilus assembly protein PilP n=2 Tax=Geothermobacter ehrlichii TaxID=213224 RepID=A0A5D3WQ78_9BACT|nr:type IV pilus assembly protein PilP [Geothermobacter ehrlichii]
MPSFLVAISCCLVLLLTGCQEESSAPAPVRVRKPRPKPKVVAKAQAAETKKAEAEYVYSPAGMRDPFAPLLQVKTPVQGKQAPLTPLQKFDLPQFRILGIIIGKGEPTAMVAVPGGKSYIVRKGVKIGKNNGVITEITTDGIHVREKYYDFSGAVRVNEQMIKLPPRRGV